jgi:transcriptional regulator with XRE-family HTH domain
VPSSLHSKDYQAFLKRLCDARKNAGLSQAQVAEALGKPQSFVSKSESGERRVDAVELAAFVSLYAVRFEQLVPKPSFLKRKKAS